MKRILVTGATGYIGAHVCEALSKIEGIEVVGTDFDLNQNDISSFVTSVIDYDIRYLHGSFENRNIDYNFIFDVVIHLAAKTSVAPSFGNETLYYDTNVAGTSNVIKSFCDENTHFIYCSTGAACQPETSPYASTKYIGEAIAAIHPNYTICRFYNVSGNNNHFKFDNSYRNIIRRLAATVYGKYESFAVHQSPTSYDGAIRNYTHVNDIVDSICRIVEAGPQNSIEFLGNNKSHNVREVVETMSKVSHTKIGHFPAEPRIGDIPKSTLPNQSKFFRENYSLEQICLSALAAERYYIDNILDK